MTDGHRLCFLQYNSRAADAALLAKSVERPVRGNRRAPMSTAAPRIPPTLVDIRAAVDGGVVTAWESEFLIPQQTASRSASPGSTRRGGLLLHAIIHPADIQDRDGGILLLATLFGMYPF